jgi:hypothetical protein
MLDKAKRFVQGAASRVGSVVHEGLASHSTRLNAVKVGAVIVAPKSTAFKFLMANLDEILTDPMPTTDLETPFPVSELRLFSICARLSEGVYSFFDSRGELPAALGEILYFTRTTAATKAIPFVITRNPDMRSIFVGFPGSYCFKDFLIDFNGCAVNVYGSLMHRGVLQSCSGVLAIADDLLCRYAREFQDNQLVFTGHSLGGAVAAAVAHRFRMLHPEIRCRAVVFGPAASVGRSLWQQSREFCTTFVLNGDPVPFLSFHNVASISSDYLPWPIADVIQKSLARMTQKSVMPTPPLDFDANPFEQPPPTLEELERAFETEVDFRTTTALFPPGELYQYKLSGKVFLDIQVKKIPSCNFFAQFVKGLYEEEHASGKYAECAERLYQTAVPATDAATE